MDYLEMELIPIEINKELVASLGGEMSPLFSQVRIYGTLEDPLFVAKDVQDILKIKNMHYKDNDGFLEWNKHKIKAKVSTLGGIREAIVLTELGLYKALFHSKSEIAEQFQMFVYVIMKRLRMTGSVTTEQAVMDLETELKKINDKFRAFNKEWDIEHRELVKLRVTDENKTMELYDKTATIYKLTEKIKNTRDPTVNELIERIERLEHKYMKRITVILHEPPKEFSETYEYTLDQFSEYDDLIDTSEVMLLSLKLTEPKPSKKKLPIAKLYIHKDVTAETIAKHLERYKTKSDFYEISIDILTQIKDDINREYEQSLS
jgi:prophage antirepressor-like protein